MLFSTVGQSRVFLTMLYAGLAVGLYANLDSAARRLFEAGRLFSLLMDFLFGVVSAVIAIIALLYAADGELRLYSLMGVLCGYLIWAGTLAPVLTRLFTLFFYLLKRFFGRLQKISIVKKFFR